MFSNNSNWNSSNDKRPSKQRNIQVSNNTIKMFLHLKKAIEDLKLTVKVLTRQMKDQKAVMDEIKMVVDEVKRRQEEQERLANTSFESFIQDDSNIQPTIFTQIEILESESPKNESPKKTDGLLTSEDSLDKERY
ncbi:hypothetical protein QTN25_008850 [Entamoeba marina]